MLFCGSRLLSLVECRSSPRKGCSVLTRELVSWMKFWPQWTLWSMGLFKWDWLWAIDYFLLTKTFNFVDMLRCYAWESSFQSKVQSVRNDELSWFRKASLLGAVCYILIQNIECISHIMWFTIYKSLHLFEFQDFLSLKKNKVIRFLFLFCWQCWMHTCQCNLTSDFFIFFGSI